MCPRRVARRRATAAVRKASLQRVAHGSRTASARGSPQRGDDGGRMAGRARTLRSSPERWHRALPPRARNHALIGRRLRRHLAAFGDGRLDAVERRAVLHWKARRHARPPNEALRQPEGVPGHALAAPDVASAGRRGVHRAWKVEPGSACEERERQQGEAKHRRDTSACFCARFDAAIFVRACGHLAGPPAARSSCLLSPELKAKNRRPTDWRFSCAQQR
jgi:hypothetical protein